MRRVSVTAVTVSFAVLLAGCTRDEPESTPPTRSAAEAAWYTSSQEQRRMYCDAYVRHDPQHPVHIPAHESAQTDEEFADDFYEVLKREC